jgi:adenosylcobyric acid synthase
MEGYDIHMGTSVLGKDARHVFEIRDNLDNSVRGDGAVNPGGNVIGTYVHGIFDSPYFRERLLSHILEGKCIGDAQPSTNMEEIFNRNVDRLADTMRRCLDIDLILSMLGCRGA